MSPAKRAQAILDLTLHLSVYVFLVVESGLRIFTGRGILERMSRGAIVGSLVVGFCLFLETRPGGALSPMNDSSKDQQP